MEKRKNQRRNSRPISELITLFDHQEVEERKFEQWQSDNSLNSTKFSDKRKTLDRSGNSAEISKSVSESALSNDVRKKDSSASVQAKPKLTLPLDSSSSVKPKKKAMESKKKLTTKEEEEEEEEVVDLPKALKEEPNTKEKDADDENSSESENCNRKKFPLDDSLAVLRREMHSLRKQDVELMSQLLALNSSIQEFKSNSSSSSMSNFSDTSDAETDITEIEIKPPTHQTWHQRESSGSDTSDVEPRRHQLRPSTVCGKHCNVNRYSLGSEVSGYYSNASPRSSPYGSNRSLNVYDVNASDTFSGSECCSPQATSPVSSDPPMMHAYHHRQKTWLSQDFLGLNGMTGSDPTLNRNFTNNGGKIQPPVHARAFHPADEKVKRMNIQQKRIQTRRNTACGAQSMLSDLSPSGSEHSLSGYDVDSDGSRTSVQAISNRLQKWQRSRSSCALNNTRQHGPSSAVQNTIKVDLRHNTPTPGTAIELILPIQPLQPTRRSSAVRMAERRPVSKLNTLSKRQSMIW